MHALFRYVMIIDCCYMLCDRIFVDVQLILCIYAGRLLEHNNRSAQDQRDKMIMIDMPPS